MSRAALAFPSSLLTGLSPVIAGLVAGCATHEQPPPPAHRAAWMQQARWGVMTHYLADWRAKVDGEPMSVEKWNDLIDRFDAEGLAEQLKSVGAGYYLITIGQNSGYYLSPNATYDKLTGIKPSKCSRRDLVADLYEPLHRRGIKLMVYLPSGAPGSDPVASAALDYEKGPNPNRDFQLKWEQVVREWSTRWGSKVAGWWFDGCYWPNAMYRSATPPNFASFAAAARAGNPASAIAFNPGVVDRILSVTPYEDYSAGEVNDPDQVMIRRAANGEVDGARIHVLSFLGQTWGMGAPRFKADQLITWTRKVSSAGGAITWDTPIHRNGLIAQPFLDQLRSIGDAMRSGPVYPESQHEEGRQSLASRDQQRPQRRTPRLSRSRRSGLPLRSGHRRWSVGSTTVSDRTSRGSQRHHT